MKWRIEMKNLLLTGAVVCALMATPAHAVKDNTRETSLPDAMLGDWCPVKRGAHIYVRSANPEADNDLCRIIKADGYEQAGEDFCKFVRIRRKGDNYIVHMKCYSAGDNENTGRRYRQVERARPIHTSVFQLDHEHLSIKE